MFERPMTSAHGAFADRFHGAFGALHIEQVIADRARLAFHSTEKSTSTMFLVAGEHQAFFRHVADGGAAAHVLGDPLPMSILLTRSACGVSAVSIG